ncbi:crosslink repair DNA glycosylase YcaQ family protein [uncultured Amaricoccus sp.]|uniref:winged helix-turn-helix domain-containing protein n=1 Tax=uncultured Amaricoccus sp. TaxID=339341 RepID=UPI002635CE41|nr:crosslink repair DNA glycosylase YcaQ family protein [uncultured Amaricoccus sp.]
MAVRAPAPATLSAAEARRIWIRAQRLDEAAPFGAGAEAVRAAVEHLGYVQIDTINVIERSHHHILWARIPAYRREDLHRALSVEKSVFEYWTHALAYIPTRDFRFFMADMARHRENPVKWFGAVTPAELRQIVARVRREGALSIRDIDDDELVEKDHPWASRKPSKRALQMAFFAGLLTVSERAGMVKSYELVDRHFGWARKPRPASEAQVVEYLLDRALGAQGIVSLESVCHLDAKRKKAVAAAVEARVARRKLLPVAVEGAGRQMHWMARGTEVPEAAEGVVHLLSPFDPLVIQRRRLRLFFGYDHLFEAYLPKEKRVLGYFALPVLKGDRIVAAIDLKADRAAGKLLMQKWTWVGDGGEADRPAIEEALGRFERFQLGDGPGSD